MTNWYVYYRLLHALHHRNHAKTARLQLQDVLVEFRTRAVYGWPGATDQQIQDWFEHLASNPTLFTEREVEHLTSMEPFAA